MFRQVLSLSGIGFSRWVVYLKQQYQWYRLSFVVFIPEVSFTNHYLYQVYSLYSYKQYITAAVVEQTRPLPLNTQNIILIK